MVSVLQQVRKPEPVSSHRAHTRLHTQVTFAAGLACEGLVPFCTIYSTFLQRGYDQVVHDVALQNLPGASAAGSMPMSPVHELHREGVVGRRSHLAAHFATGCQVRLCFRNMVRSPVQCISWGIQR